jgi:tetratricopeptide (TPR) repeat protein
MLSKPSTVILPLVLLLCVWWERGGLSRSDRGWWRADLWRIVPFFILALGMSAWTILEQRGHVLRTGTTEWKLSMAERLVIAGKAVWFYAAKLFWPVRLTFVYSRWAMDAEALSSWMPLAGLIVVGSVLWARRRQSWARAGLFGIGFFVAALLPVLGFFDVYYFRYSFVADHFQYLASVGLIAIIAGGGRMVCDRAGRLGRQAGAVAGPVIMLSMAVLTWRQARIYHDAETLWRDTLTKNPQCWMAHTNLGVTLASLHHAREAIEQYKQALRIKPDFATAHNDLGLALTEQGNLPEAIAHYEQAVLIQPGYAEAHSNLGFTLVRLGRVQEAIAHYKRALQIEPEYVQAQYNWGNALLRANKPQEAIEHYEQAVRIDPDLAEAHYNLGLALMGQGELQEAISHYQKALQIKPDYVQAQYNWGNALLRANQPPEAIEHYEQAVRIDPDYVPARNNLAAVLMGQGRLSEAINHLEQVVRLTPEVAMAHYNLGFASEQAGQIQQAIQQYEQALRINPDFVEAQQALARARAAH